MKYESDLDIHVMEQKSDIVIMQLTGSLDCLGANRLESIATALYDKGCRRVVFSCEFLRYISSAGLKALLEIARRLDTRSGVEPGLALCCVNCDIADVLDLSGLLRCVLVYDDIPQARQVLRKKGA